VRGFCGCINTPYCGCTIAFNLAEYSFQAASLSTYRINNDFDVDSVTSFVFEMFGGDNCLSGCSSGKSEEPVCDASLLTCSDGVDVTDAVSRLEDSVFVVKVKSTGMTGNGMCTRQPEGYLAYFGARLRLFSGSSFKNVPAAASMPSPLPAVHHKQLCPDESDVLGCLNRTATDYNICNDCWDSLQSYEESMVELDCQVPSNIQEYFDAYSDICQSE
jgi:hypothetical protein